ncbi:MAG: DNA mismatch repair endonuclease MutL [Pseudomonadota bacterium]
MGKIHVLSELVANKIAAGEVVERPASIIKELIENALDAGSKNISVTIGYGGKSHIKIKDDGCGMDREDAQACILRHATSKIVAAEDIERIGTLGFRGEALPSIASVSRFTLTTRQPGEQTATSIKISGGAIEAVRECVSEPGTTIEVSDLFYNTPARKKFLKSDAAEYNAIAEIFDTLALSRKDVGFFLFKNSIAAADYPARTDMLDRIEQIYSPEFKEKLYGVTVEKPDFKLTGYVGTPDNTRINRTGQKFFINNRPVQAISLSSALSRAYEEFLEHRRFPVAVLFLDIDCSYVDANVHPAKREVRIRNERFFQDIIVQAIKKELQHRGGCLEGAAKSSAASFPETSCYAPGPGSRISFHTLNEAAAEWKVSAPPAEIFRDNIFSPPSSPAYGQASISNAINRNTGEENQFKNIKIIGQALGTYIIAEQGETLAVFDQHAAHERILYEELLAALSTSAQSSQKIIFPLTLHLTLQETPLMEKYREDFESLGFNINPLGGGTFSVDAVPSCMTDKDAGTIIKDTLHELMESQTPKSWETRRQTLAATLACKTYAVKAGKHLDIQEMEHLIQKLGTKNNPLVCPHGRPTFFLITKDDLERRFKRK